ncbi:hypothetical protein, partial [Klenkia sp. PcliD-1-E]|uniref:hypothetical protein n=1 Tax=Klenkia sp. PcliD-1-E TaxID=2954492 RepID=UPI00209787FF
MVLDEEDDVARAGAALLLGVAAFLPFLLVLRPPPAGTPAVAGWATAALLAVLGLVALRRPRALPAGAWTWVGVGGAVAVAAL